jgi:acetoin utilization deacetylase AcuC-like enzyme
VTREIAWVAAARAGGRIVSVLEGGYDLPALAASATAHVEALIAAGA